MQLELFILNLNLKATLLSDLIHLLIDKLIALKIIFSVYRSYSGKTCK